MNRAPLKPPPGVKDSSSCPATAWQAETGSCFCSGAFFGFLVSGFTLSLRHEDLLPNYEAQYLA